MKIGLTIPTMMPRLGRDKTLTWARRIDEGPFSSLAAGERITFDNLELMVTMSAAAAVTERVELVLTVVVLPLHSEALIAKQIATLDVLSNGRVTLGVGVGGREHDYRAAGRPFEKRGRTQKLQVETIRRIWAGESIDGELDPIGPTPIQAGGPKILIGALEDGSIRRAARWADGVCGFGMGPDVNDTIAAWQALDEGWSAAERTGRPRKTMSCWYALGPNGRRQMDKYVKRYLGIFGAETAATLAAMCTTTSEAALRDVIASQADAGTDELILVPTTDDPDDIHRLSDLIG